MDATSLGGDSLRLGTGVGCYRNHEHFLNTREFVLNGRRKNSVPQDLPAYTPLPNNSTQSHNKTSTNYATDSMEHQQLLQQRQQSSFKTTDITSTFNQTPDVRTRPGAGGVESVSVVSNK